MRLLSFIIIIINEINKPTLYIRQTLLRKYDDR